VRNLIFQEGILLSLPTMQNNILLKKLCFGLLFLLSFQISFSQRDSISELPIVSKSKPLQFGNDIFLPYTSNIPLSIEEDRFSFTLNQNHLIYNPERDPKRLLYNTGLFVGAAVASFAILWVMPESVTNWDKEQMLEDGLLNRWKENVKAGPVVDGDNFFLNYVMHPYSGAVYYMSARGSGFEWWESFTYATIMSTFFWEYGIEAFAEIPSWQDLIVTPILGSAMGEGFFILKGKIVRNDSRVLNSRVLGYSSLFLIDPFNSILDVLGYKTKHKIEAYSIIAPIDYDFNSQKSIWGLQVIARF
jgi:hypothetical protein